MCYTFSQCSTPNRKGGEGKVEVQTAIELIGSLSYKPDWVMEATDHSNRFEATIQLKITYPAFESNREEAREGVVVENRPYATFPLVVGDCQDDCALYYRVLDCIMEIELHEAREFLRVHPTLWAPFHPHKIEGMKRFAATEPSPTLTRDLLFGTA